MPCSVICAFAGDHRQATVAIVVAEDDVNRAGKLLAQQIEHEGRTDRRSVAVPMPAVLAVERLVSDAIWSGCRNRRHFVIVSRFFWQARCPRL